MKATIMKPCFQMKKRTSRLYRFLCLATLFGFFLQNCKPKEDTISPQQAVTGDNTLNRTLLTSRDEEILRVDPNTGKHQRVGIFEDRVNVRSMDYANGVVYAGAMDNSVNAVDLQAGKLLWGLPLPQYQLTVSSEPTVVVKDGTVYVAGLTGVLFAIDVATQKPKWAYPLNPSGAFDRPFTAFGSPSVLGDRVIIGTNSGIISQNHLHVIDKATGRRVWRKPINGVSGSIKQVGGTLLVPAQSLFALDAATGDVRWEFKTSPTLHGVGTPSVAGNKVLVQGASTAGDGRLFCLDLVSGQQLWEVDAGNNRAGRHAPLVVGDAVFGVYETGSEAAFLVSGRAFLADVNTGGLIWKNDDLSIRSALVYANGRLFCYGQNLKGTGSTSDNVGLMSLKASDGSLVWLNSYFASGGGTSPIIIADNGTFRSSNYAE